VSEAAYYGWRRKYGSLEVSEAKRMKTLEEENARLKRLVANYAMEIDILKAVNAKKW
jgi:putative transposase